jgi:inorganic pyrophosphatase
MRIDLIPAGDNPPESLNVLIEVPIGGEPVKYEFDKESGALFVDRFLHTPMRYPANYGFVPHTLGEDGDPLDALVVARSPIVAGAVVKCRPIGVLLMEDDKGGDEKLLCVPVNDTFPYYAMWMRPSGSSLNASTAQRSTGYDATRRRLDADCGTGWLR